MKLHPRSERLESESAFRVLGRARELERAGRDVLHLEIGQPDFPSPRHVVDAAVEALRAGHTGYGPAPGLPELREAIAADSTTSRGVPAEASQVVVTPGAKAVMAYVIDALAGPGDEVIYPDPGFPMYASLIAHAGARGVPMPLRQEREFRFDPDHFRSQVGERTRLIIVNSPQNPTGGCLLPDDLEVIAEEAHRVDAAVLSDEVYRHFHYEGSFTSIARLPGMASRTIILDGCSKSFSMTGWRIGWAIAPPAVAAVMELYNVNFASCAPTFNQWGALAALTGPRDDLRAMVAEFRARRDLLVAGLNRLPGVSCLSPAGAFYAFPDISQTGRDADRLQTALLEEAGVAVLSGSAFGPEGNGHLRISYAASREVLEEALTRMARFLSRPADRS